MITDVSAPGRGRRGAPKRVTELTSENVAASTGCLTRARERSMYVTLGSGTYVVMCATFLAGMEGSFKVRALGARANEVH